MTTVSVIIPCRNYGHFIADAIQSVLSQTREGIELLVVDYGSEDSTRQIVARYPSARLIAHPIKEKRATAQSISKARNFGLKNTSGEFVIFLDADDILTTNAIGSSVALLELCQECAFVYGHEGHFGEQGPVDVGGLSPGKCLSGDPYGEMLSRNHPLRGPGAMIYRRTFLERAGGFNIKLHAAEDLDLNLRLVREHPIICNDRVVLRARVHDVNMSQRWPRMLAGTVSAQKNQKHFAKTRPEYWDKYKDGLRLARDYCGGHLELEVYRLISQRRYRSAAAGLYALARHAPNRIFSIPIRLWRRLAPSIKKMFSQSRGNGKA